MTTDPKDKSSSQDKDDLFVAEEASKKESYQEIWEVLVVDDETDVHRMTRVILDDFTFADKRLKIISAHSAEEAKRLLEQYPGIALILLDVVMETTDSGLKLVEHIRKNMQNPFVRIILRTGQPGHAPEREVIRRYDINDYANKTELTGQRTFSIVTANLRAYSEMMTIESHRQQLEEKVAERTRELTEKNNRLMELNKHLFKLNQEKNEFLSIAAHDLKNPLAAIQFLATMIGNGYHEISREEIVEMANLISSSSQQMFRLIKNILDINVIESGKLTLSLEFVKVLPVLQSVINHYKEQAKSKNITLQLHRKQCSTVFADESVIYQVLDNLISNAVKYSSCDKNIHISLYQSTSYVCCEIQDEGPGLSAEDKKKLFGKFSRLTPKPTGQESSTGLGLFIVKKLMEAIKGKVWCESELGHGAKFTVEFPTSAQHSKKSSDLPS